MDKILKLHHNVWCQKSPTEPNKHAAITEYLMGKFADWVGGNATRHRNGGWYLNDDYKVNGRPTETYTTSELIQLFKETL